MDMLGASVLFTRAGNTHNQLSDIVRTTKDPKYIKMLEVLDAIYRLGNTRANREKMQQFIVQHGEEIYREFSKHHLSFGQFGQNDFGYDLKE